MKVAPLVLWALVSSSLWAQDGEIESLLQSGQYRDADGREQLRSLTSELTGDQKQALYTRYEVSGWWMLGNLYPVLPVGSLLQGDFPICVAMGGTTLAGGLIASLANFDSTSSPVREILTYGGLAVAAFGYGWSLVEPWLFAQEQNRNLRDALGQEP